MPEPEPVTLEMTCTREFADLVAGLAFATGNTKGRVILAGLGLVEIAYQTQLAGGRLVVVNADGTETDIEGVLTPCPTPS